MKSALLAACALLAMPAISAAQQLDFSKTPVSGNMPQGKRPGNPTYDMPAGQRLISSFGERPAFSPNGGKIAFIGKSYGDAYEYEVKTGAVRNLTAHTPHQGFLRVQYFNNGDILLIGPHVPGKTWAETRASKIELFWMDAAATKAPVPLGVTIFEGVATSRYSNRIAWTETNPALGNDPTKGTTLKTAELVVTKTGAALAKIQTITTTTDCATEAQDFLPGEKGVTLPCYHFKAKPNGEPTTEVLSIDFATKVVTRYPTPPELYGEVEGIFPGGKRTLVECSGDRSAGMDLCVLELKPNNPLYTRITHIVDYGRWKYGNPTVSPDGRTIAAQVGSADVLDVGQGQGIVLIDVPKSF